MSGKQHKITIMIVLTVGIVIAVLGKWEWLVWGLVLICPLMHLFGHNHSGHNHSESDGSKHHH